jgi:DNA-binding transcriptional LysR family regulator
MELRQLQHFLALADLRSFRLAGERVNLTQQAVSKSIAQLEKNIGCQLFEREGRSVRLTTVGELLLPHARAVTAELKHFDSEHDAVRGARSGRLAVGATPTLLGDVVPDVLARLHRTFPRIVLSVSTGNWDALLERLLRGDLDVILSTEPVGPVQDPVTVERLCAEYNVLVAAANHPLVGQKPTARQLQKASWIALDRLPRADADLRRYFEASRLKPPIPGVRTEATTFAISWVVRTNFLCVLPSRAVARAVASGDVAILDVTLTDPAWSLVAGYRRSAPKSPALLSFIDGLREALR